MIKIITVKGAPYELGFEIGKKAAKQMQAGAAFYCRHWRKFTGLSWTKSQTMIRSAWPLTKKFLPKTFEELKGMSDGSEIPFDTLFLINSMETLERARPSERCTSILIHPSRSATETTLIGHNEDWITKDQDWIYLIRGQPQGEPAFLSLTYGAWIPQYGVNETGLAFVADSHTATDARPGISQTLIGREILRYRHKTKAMAMIKKTPRADGHTFLMATPTGGLALEITAKKEAELAVTNQRPVLVHSNFYQHQSTARFEKDSHTYSRFRFYRSHELLAGLNHPLAESDLFRALADHLNFPESVCGHTETSGSLCEERTIASLVIDPNRRSIALRANPPCAGKIQTTIL
ncbi:hypothetical protein HY628_01665 [Candidatus Uhrbacteria bacterium]|nr:hypothetical protein [Candidatus Uhrbacteria bacterium]